MRSSSSLVQLTISNPYPEFMAFSLEDNIKGVLAPGDVVSLHCEIPDGLQIIPMCENKRGIPSKSYRMWDSSVELTKDFFEKPTNKRLP